MVGTELMVPALVLAVVLALLASATVHGAKRTRRKRSAYRLAFWLNLAATLLLAGLAWFYFA